MYLNLDTRILKNQCALRAHHGKPGPWHWLAFKYHTFWHVVLSIVTASGIGRYANIHPSVKFPHPNGVMIHNEAVVGEGCMIMQQVTIGMIGGSAAKIGKNVYIGAGAKILGEVTIGDGARIGANAVVIRDVPAGATAVGVPARIIPPKKVAAVKAAITP